MLSSVESWEFLVDKIAYYFFRSIEKKDCSMMLNP